MVHRQRRNLKMFTSRIWWLRTAERAVKTMCQTILATVGARTFGFEHLPWATIGVAVGVMGLLSFATSVVTTPMGGDKTDPGVV